jgi:hypothetical protein
MRFRLLKPKSSANPPVTPEEILLRADALFRAERSKDLRGVIAWKLKDLEHYDVPAMDRVVSICFFGKSGSLLLASYLDGHEDVMSLPALCGADLYKFFELYPSLSLRDKLIAYPAHTQSWAPFFEGDFAISPSHYYAAVQAILEFYATWPSDFLESRRAFFLFVHIAYNLALGRPPGARPLIVFQQHWRNDATARQLVEDFPKAQFIHTVRDPITLAGQILEFRLLVEEPVGDSDEIRRPAAVKKPPLSLAERGEAAFQQFFDLLHRKHLRPINGDRPHLAMESRTRAVRFEDLHSDTATTMRGVSDWLGLSYRASLIESTFNGIPWVVTRGGKAWSGPRLEQAQRDLRFVSPKDRALLFAAFYEHFAEWNYPCPKAFGNLIVRCFVFVTLFLAPTKVEIIATRALFKNRILPGLLRGDISTVMRSLRRIVFYRITISALYGLEFVGQRVYAKALLQVDPTARPPKQCDKAAGAAHLKKASRN